MASRRQLRAELDRAETERDEALAHIRRLEKGLREVGESRAVADRREQGQADRILRLERQLKDARDGAPAEVTSLRRQLELTQKQLDDATRTGDMGWGVAGPKPGVTA